MLKNNIGINYCFAKLLLEKNCNVVIADLALRPEAQKLIDEYTSQPRAVFVKTNVVIWDELTNMFDVAEKEFGGADIVCQLLYASLFGSANVTDNTRYAPAPASSNRTGAISGTLLELRNRKMTLMALTE
jgi:NAD(P)-dependent dehydrogenase (short-subunit alcohol dehydrogenase family)